MNWQKKLTLLLLLTIGNMAYGHDECNYKSMIAKIDSISKVNGVKLGKVKILYVTNTFDKTDTDKKSLTKASHFHFDGRFLVIEDKYFNLDKLVYFYINEEVMEFYLQAY